MANIISQVSSYFYGFGLIFILIGTGIFFTFKLHCIQISGTPDAIIVLAEPKKNKNSISSFQALMVSTGSRAGAGNIIGVASAIMLGGPGAVFWMWVSAFIGGTSAFIEATLAQIYKVRGKSGSYGGPAYYMKALSGRKLPGLIFAATLIITYAIGFNTLASNTIAGAVALEFPESNRLQVHLAVGVFLSIITALVVFGGTHRISSFNTIVVPIMVFLFLGLCLYIVFKNISVFPKVLSLIFTSAFEKDSAGTSVLGGFAGSAMMFGIRRGLYSNEAGIGSAPNAAASADTSHPAKQGLAQMLSVFIDTLLLCSATAFMLLCSEVPYGNSAQGYVVDAVSSCFGSLGSLFVEISVFCFAWVSMIGNFFYCDINLDYIKPGFTSKRGAVFTYRILVLATIFLGAMADLKMLWNLTDILIGIMVMINIPFLILGGNKAADCYKDYLLQKKLIKNPVFKASRIHIKGTDYW